MKIGIITWFKGNNYGTNLQAIALQQFLRNESYDVKLINFDVTATYHHRRNLKEKILYQPEKYITKYSFYKYKDDIRRRDSALEQLVRKHCIFTPEINNNQEYIDICNSFDVIICGSDQIWNPNWYNRCYYADFPEINVRKIAYAPSIGVNTIPENQINEIKRSLSSFEVISVREDQGAEILSNILPYRPKVVMDPTFLLTKEQWLKFTSQRKYIEDEKYVLSMFLTDNILHWRAANKFAQKKRMKHVIVPFCGFSYLHSGTVCAGVGIEELLNIINGASYVLTDSFHITVFSLIFQRQFYTFKRFKENKLTSTNARVSSLLKMVRADNHLLTYGTTNITEVNEIDYSFVSNRLDTKIIESKTFLLETLCSKILDK